MLHLTWNEAWFVAFLFLLVWVVGYLPRLGNLIGDFLYGYRSAAGKRDSDTRPRSSGSGPGPAV